MFVMLRFIKHCALLCVLLVLSGCAAKTLVISKTALHDSVYRLGSAQVNWTDSASIPYKIYAAGRGESFDMSDAEKAQTHKAIGQLLSLFRESTGMRVREQLAKKYALNGKHAFLELTPVAAYYVLNGAGGRRLDIRASIKKDVATAEVWSVTISVFGQRNETDQAMLDNFSIALIDELAKAGWLN